MQSRQDSRRKFLTHSALGALAITAPTTMYDHHPLWNPVSSSSEELSHLYPAIDYNRIRDTVGASHMNLERVKELVTEQPELANACWDWGFGDMETAIGAASHMGQVPIAEFLMKHGARPDIYTFAMLGSLDAVKAMVEAAPGVQRNLGPHGITLLQHAKNRLRWDLTPSQEQSVKSVINYLESLGDADIVVAGEAYVEDEVSQYFGEYQYGKGENEIFEVSMNRRNLLSIAKKGDFGRSLRLHGPHLFHVQGCASGRVQFNAENDQIISLSILAPMKEVTATKV